MIILANKVATDLIVMTIVGGRSILLLFSTLLITSVNTLAFTNGQGDKYWGSDKIKYLYSADVDSNNNLIECRRQITPCH